MATSIVVDCVARPPSSSTTLRLTAYVPLSVGTKLADPPVRANVLASGRVTVQLNVRGSFTPAGSVADASTPIAVPSKPVAGTLNPVIVGARLATSIVVDCVARPPSSSTTLRLTAYVPLSVGTKLADPPVRANVLASGRVTVQLNVRGSFTPAGSVADASTPIAVPSKPVAGTLNPVIVGARLATSIVVDCESVPPLPSSIVTVTVYSPSSAYVWLPANEPSVSTPGAPGTSMIASSMSIGVPSPQLML